MNLDKFLSFNKNNLCPICGNKLTLYLQCLGEECFKAFESNTNYINFQQLNSKGKFKNEVISLIIPGDDLFNLDFSSEIIRRYIKSKNIYLFYLCNEDSFSGGGDDYEIVTYKACYYRSSRICSYIEQEIAGWNYSDNDHEYGLNFYHETLAFINKEKDLEKIYIINSDSLKNKSTMWFYTSDTKVSSLFTKELPFLENKLNFDPLAREKLFEKLDNWILIS